MTSELIYNPLTSQLDKLLRYLYAGFYQKETYHPDWQVSNQYRFVPIFFHLRRLIRKYKPGLLPIRIVFLAQNEGSWYYMESIYQACVSDPAFQTKVISIGFDVNGVHWDANSYLVQNKIDFLDGMHESIRLDRLHADLFILASPYDDHRPDQYSAVNLLRFAKYAYIGYGIDFSDHAGVLSKQIFGNNTQKNAWRIFSRSRNTFHQYKKYAKVPPRRIAGLGLPTLDRYFTNSEPSLLPQSLQEASHGKFKIIYTPHHSIYGWSTFLKYGDLIKRLIQENENCFLVFRPHPLLIYTLENANIMSKEEFRNFFDHERIYLYEEPNYYSLFRWSNLLISDASSFLCEYAPSHNPIIYLHREDGWGGLDDTIETDIFNSCYVARNESEIISNFKQILGGSDPLKGIRDQYQKNISSGMFTGDAGKRIAQYLHRNLG